MQGTLCTWLLLALGLLTLPAADQDAEAELLGTWIGRSNNVRGYELVLEEGGKGSLAGERLTWRITGKGQLRYRVAGESATCSYRIQGSTLSFVEDGETSRFRRKREPKPPEKKPPEKKPEQEAQEPAAPGETRKPEGPLTGIDRGVAKRHAHPRGWYSFDLPVGWEIAEQEEDGLLINPGLTDTLDAIVLVTHGELDEGQRNQEVTRLLDGHSPELLAELKTQGIRLDRAAKPSRKVTVGEVPGAVQRWTGKTSDGKPVTLWIGGVTKRDHWMGVSLLVLGKKESEFLPGAKRLFSTLELAPPERNRKLEQVLAGHSFAHNETTESGSYTTSYELRADLSLFKQSFFSSNGISGGSDATGRWEVIGDEVFLYLEDGQRSGQVVLEGGRPSHLLIGSSRYGVQ